MINSAQCTGLFLELRGPVTEAAVAAAAGFARARHPALRVGIRTVDGRPEFAAATAVCVPLEVTVVESLSDVDWEGRLMAMVNRPRDLALSPVYLEFVTTAGRAADDRRDRTHYLFALMNHAAVDAPGLFRIFSSFCEYLGHLVSGTSIPKPKPHEFLDLLERVQNVTVDVARPEVPAFYLPPLLAEKGPCNESCEPVMRGLFAELDSRTTRQLLENCRLHGCTVQGVVSLASMIAVARAQRDRFPLPQLLAVQAPFNMRSLIQPPVLADMCECASSALWWTQLLEPDQKLFDVALKATRRLQSLRDDGFGLAWLNWLQNDGFAPPFTVMSSSIGANPIKPHYEKLQVARSHMLGGFYGVATTNSAPTTTHAHTFCGRLCMTFGYPWPAISDRTANAVMNTQIVCLRLLASQKYGGVTIGDMMKGIGQWREA